VHFSLGHGAGFINDPKLECALESALYLIEQQRLHDLYKGLNENIDPSLRISLSCTGNYQVFIPYCCRHLGSAGEAVIDAQHLRAPGQAGR
jgi:hypothetical protein